MILVNGEGYHLAEMIRRLCQFVIVTVFLATYRHFAASTRLIYNGTAEVEQKTLLRTRSGPVSGLITVRNEINVSCYLGVPYAEPPTGERRFAQPTPVKPWKSM